MTRFENWLYRQFESWPLWIVLIVIWMSLYWFAEAYDIGNP